MPSSNFLDLPAELRNRIYQLHKDDFGDRRPYLHISHDFQHFRNFPFPITRVSRQVRAETAALFYSGLRVEIFLRSPDDRRNDNDSVLEWIKLMPEEGIKALGELEIWPSRKDCDCGLYDGAHYQANIVLELPSMYSHRNGKIEVLVGEDKFDRCWVTEQCEAVEAKIESILRDVQPAHGMLRLPKSTLVAVLEYLSNMTD